MSSSDELIRRTRESIDKAIESAADAHRSVYGHEVASRPGDGWACAICDADIYEAFCGKLLLDEAVGQPDPESCVSCGHADPIRGCGCRECSCSDRPHVRVKPHYRYPDWPAETTIYFDQGFAQFKNDYDGSFCFVTVGYGAHSSSAALTLPEMIELKLQLDKAIDEQTDLVAKYDPYNEEEG